VVAEVATVLGCTIGLKEAVTAITLVAIGTSLPDTFASMTAAKSSEYADSAIGNVTGSNSVNVFVGLGIPWIISAVYAEQHN
jgi:solute carrier family 8 (sodium/calcium exchanger)